MPNTTNAIQTVDALIARLHALKDLGDNLPVSSAINLPDSLVRLLDFFIGVVRDFVEAESCNLDDVVVVLRKAQKEWEETQDC